LSWQDVYGTECRQSPGVSSSSIIGVSLSGAHVFLTDGLCDRALAKTSAVCLEKSLKHCLSEDWGMQGYRPEK